MVIISTSAVAEIIQAVSAASIFGGGAVSASAGTQPSAMEKAAMPQNARTGNAFVVIDSPLVGRLRWRCSPSTGAKPPGPTRAASNRVLQSVRIGLAGADAHRALDSVDENLAVADLAGLGGVGNGVHHLVDLVVVDGDVEAYLGQEVHGVFGAAIDFLVALLPAVAFDLGDRHALHTDPGEGVANVFELEWFDDGDDQFHGSSRAERPGGAAE